MTPCQEKHYQRKMANYNQLIARCLLAIKGATCIREIETQEDHIKYYIGLINQLKEILKADL